MIGFLAIKGRLFEQMQHLNSSLIKSTGNLKHITTDTLVEVVSGQMLDHLSQILMLIIILITTLMLMLYQLQHLSATLMSYGDLEIFIAL